MNSRKLIALSLAAFLIIVAALWIGYSRTPRSGAQARLYPDLKGHLANVQGVSVFKGGDQPVLDLVRDGANWKVKQRHDYPADNSKVNALLINLEDATLREQKTANAANYGALGVQDVSDASAPGVRLELIGITPPIKLIIGKHDQTTRSTYVRRAGEPQSWQIGAEIEIAPDVTQWLKRDLVNIGADRIQEVSVQLAGTTPYSSVKNARADANFDIKGLPKGRELNSVAAANAVAQTLSTLQLDDVRPAAELSGEKSGGRVVFRTFDGLVVECMGYSMGEQRWITLQASFDQDAAKRFHMPTLPTKDQPAKDQPAKEASSPEQKTTVPNPSDSPSPASSLETLIKNGQEEAKALNASNSTWAYALPPFKYDAIFKPIEDLLKKPEMLKKK
jgi:hypothetical protein